MCQKLLFQNVIVYVRLTIFSIYFVKLVLFSSVIYIYI